MKALILAAGLGTRLLPFTENLPKPLFPIAGRPLLDIIIGSLVQAGCQSVIINTHHLHRQIDAFIAEQAYSIPVHTRYEPEILGTGGAIKNVADFWNDMPFMVVNSDIVTNIDLSKVYQFHLKHPHPATLVLYDDPTFNSVAVNNKGFITGFHDQHAAVIASDPFATDAQNRHTRDNSQNAELKRPVDARQNLTFTGIQVLNPEILDLIPAGVCSSSIDAYNKLILKKRNICAFIPDRCYWKDIGTPERYQQAAFKKIAPDAFSHAFSDFSGGRILCSPIKGDGSDRKWYRLSTENRSLIMVSHGIRPQGTTGEADAFVKIGRHLYDKKIPVPRVYLDDTFSGMIFLEDLGDTNLQAIVQGTKNPDRIVSLYKTVIDLLTVQSVKGAEGFDTSWTCQTQTYDRSLILEKECRYFVDAFLTAYLGLNISFDDLKDDFFDLADKALSHAVTGFMHRDMQSRNIMVKNNCFYFIDFQGGRLGPVQYDLASLLIDPYVALPLPVQKQLLNYSADKLSASIPIEPAAFLKGYRYCTITRNLQILGAFGYLSRVKGKTYFEQYIPIAVKTLKQNLSALEGSEFSKLKGIVQAL